MINLSWRRCQSRFIGATNRLGIALAVPPNPEYTGVPQH
jgi:hypothetical protein